MISCLPYLEGNYDSVVVESNAQDKLEVKLHSMMAVMLGLSNLFHWVHHSLAKTDPIYGLSRNGSKLSLFMSIRNDNYLLGLFEQTCNPSKWEADI